MKQKGKMVNAVNGKSMEQLRTETEKISQYIRQCGYNLIELWECKWTQLKCHCLNLRQFIQKQRKHLHNKPFMTEKEIIDAVKSNELFGLVECDISVPPHLKAHFAEMTPIFKNIKISLDDVGETMRQFVRENKLMSQPC